MEPDRFRKHIWAVSLVAVLLFGIVLRLPPSLFADQSAIAAVVRPNPMFTGVGFDENLYRQYVNGVIKEGLGAYPQIVDHYIEVQKGLPGSILPPVRFLYIFAAYLWHSVFGSETLAALHNVASFFSILTLLLATIAAWRLAGPRWALGVAALMACAPTQIHMSQHALVDGFFTFWALLCVWLLWENLRAPRRPAWLAAYALAFACCVMTKENSFFVFVGVAAVLVANRWLKWGTVTRELLAATVLGPLLGVVGLIFVAGGVETLIATYRLSVSKNYTLQYAILTGDGPWHRYLVDLLLVSPVVLLLAIATIFKLNRDRKAETFVAVFIGATYLLMCNIKYGMNLRYANMWDMPLRLLAFSQLDMLAAGFVRYKTWLVAGAVAAICASELRQYHILFVQFPLYELVTEGLVRALHILKSAGTLH